MKNRPPNIGLSAALIMLVVVLQLGVSRWRSLQQDELRKTQQLQQQQEEQALALEDAKTSKVIAGRELAALRDGMTACETLNEARETMWAMERYARILKGTPLPMEWMGVAPDDAGVALDASWFAGQISLIEKWQTGPLEEHGVSRKVLAELKERAARLTAQIDAALAAAGDE